MNVSTDIAFNRVVLAGAFIHGLAGFAVAGCDRMDGRYLGRWGDDNERLVNMSDGIFP